MPDIKKILAVDNLDAMVDPFVQFNDRRYAIFGRLFNTEEIKPGYFSANTYTEGMLVSHNDHMWVCKVASTTGPFDEDAWEQIDLIEYFRQGFLAAFPGYEPLITTTFNQELGYLEEVNPLEVKLEAIRNALLRLYKLMPGTAEWLGVDDYSSIMSYDEGDLCIYSNKMYRYTKHMDPGTSDWTNPSLFADLIELGASIADGHQSGAFINAIVPYLKDTDLSVRQGYLYQYQGKMYQAESNCTKEVNESWADLGVLTLIQLKDIVYSGENETNFVTLEAYNNMTEEERRNGDYVIIDSSLYGTRVKIVDSVDEYNSVALPGDDTMYLVPGKYSTIEVYNTRAEYEELSNEEKMDGSVRFVKTPGESESNINDIIASMVAAQLSEVTNMLEDHENRIRALE